MAGSGFVPAAENNELVGEELRETQPGAPAVGTFADLELVGERPDDRDPEPTFGQLLRSLDGLSLPEAGAAVGDLDDEPVRPELVDDLDEACSAVAVGVADRVRARLGQSQLEVAERLVGDWAQPCDPG